MKIASVSYGFWEDSAEVEQRYEDIIDSEIVLNRFLDLFCRDEFLGEAVLVNSTGFDNRRLFGMPLQMAFLRLSTEQFMSMRKEIVDSCIGRGHLSVFFFPKRGDEFLETFHSYGYYDMPAWQGTVISLREVPMGSPDVAIHLGDYLDTVGNDKPTSACAFSHDAQLFCVLHFQWAVD